MAYAVGILVGLATILLGRVVGYDRDRTFYSAIVIVTASYYCLFAVMGGDRQALVAESIAMAVFLAAAIIGFTRNAWLLVAAMLGHGAFDLVHERLIADRGVPDYWPAFCLAFDVVVAIFIAVLLRRGAYGPSAITA